MFTKKRNPQGYRVRKTRVQDPMSYFAQNGMKNPPDEVNPLDYLQPEMSPFIRGQKEAAYFNSDWNDLMYSLAELQKKSDKGVEMAPRSAGQVGMQVIKEDPQSSYITASDIASLADARAGEDAVMGFDDLMSQIAYGESRNRNIYQDAPKLRQSRKAQGEYQMEAAAREEANNHLAAIAKATGKDFVPFTDEQLSDIVNNLSKEQRDLLAYAYMYGPEDVKTADVLTGRVDVPEFWMQNWNKGRVDRSREFGERLKDYPGR